MTAAVSLQNRPSRWYPTNICHFYKSYLVRIFLPQLELHAFVSYIMTSDNNNKSVGRTSLSAAATCMEVDTSSTLESHTVGGHAPFLSPDDAIQPSTTTSHRIRLAIGLFLLGFIAFVVADSLTNHYIKTAMKSFLQWVEANPGSGVLVFMLVIFCTTLLFIPGIILTFGSGYVFSNAFGLGVGVLLGSIAVFVGASCGAISSFLLGRFLLRDCVAGLTKRFKLFEAIDKAMEEKGLRIMILLRLSPLIYVSPYLNYGAGGMAVSFGAFTISLLGIIPATIMFVFLGASAGSLADSSEGDSKTTKIVLIIGIILSVFGVALTTYYARLELRKVTASATQNQDDGLDRYEAEPNQINHATHV